MTKIWLMSPDCFFVIGGDVHSRYLCRYWMAHSDASNLSFIKDGRISSCYESCSTKECRAGHSEPKSTPVATIEGNCRIGNTALPSIFATTSEESLINLLAALGEMIEREQQTAA